MKAIRNILVIVDAAAADHPAVLKGALLAEKFAAKLALLACKAELRAHVENLALHLRARGLDVTTDAFSAAPLHVALLERVTRTGAELIVKNAHHHTLARRTVFTNPDWELIRRVPASLLLTKSTPWSSEPSVLAAVGSSNEHDRAASFDHCILECAALLARRLAGRLHAMHSYVCKVPVVAPMISGPLLATTVSPQSLAAVHATKLKHFTSIATEYALPPANIHLEMGGVRDSICRVALEVRANIVVIGALSCNGLTRAFKGNTAEEVMERVPCDALIVKS